MNLEDYLKGYEEGLSDAWNEILRMVSRGHTSREIQLMVKSKLATIYQILAAKRSELTSRTPSFSVTSLKEQRRVVQHKTPPVRLSRGIYLVREESGEKSFQLFREMVNEECAGLCIVRTYPQILRDQHKLENVRMVWLTQSEGFAPGVSAVGVGIEERTEERLPPTHLSQMSGIIKTFIKENPKAALLIEGLEYLITQNSFDKVLKFIQYVNEAVTEAGAVLIIPLDPSTLGEREYSLLKKEIRNEI